MSENRKLRSPKGYMPRMIKRISIINAGTKNASTEIPLCVLRSALIAVVLLPFILVFSVISNVLPFVIKQQIILQAPVIVECFPTFLHRRKSAVHLSHTCCTDHRVFLPKPGQTALQGRQWQITVLQHIHCQIISTGLSVRLLLDVKVAPDHIRYFIF